MKTFGLCDKIDKKNQIKNKQFGIIMNLLLVTVGGAIIDLLALVVLVLMTIWGAKRGFVKSFISTFGSLLSFLLSVLLCSVVANFLERTYGSVSSMTVSLSGTLSNIFGKQLMDTTLAGATQGEMSSGGIAAWIITLVFNLKGSSSVPTDVTLNQIVSPVLAYYIVCIIALACLYVIFRIIFYIIGEMAEDSHKFKLTEVTDKGLGALFGFIEGIIIIDIAILIIGAIPLGFTQAIAYDVGNSVITSLIQKTNLIGLLFDLLLKNGVSGFIAGIL